MILDIAQHTIEADAAEPNVFLPLLRGLNRVSVVYQEDVTGTLVPKFTTDPSNPDSFKTVTRNGTDLSLTGTDYFMVHGPGYLCWTLSSLSNDGKIDVQATR